MIVLGLQFGHDGSACVIKDGRILAYVYREREARTKHIIGLTTNEINLVLERAGIEHADIDFVSIVSTQSLEILSGLIDDFSIRFERHRNDTAPSPLADLLNQLGVKVEQGLSFQLRQLFQNPDENDLQYQVYSKLCAEKDLIGSSALASTGWLDNYISTEQWNRGATLSEIASTNVSAQMDSKESKYGFHYPVTVAFRGRDIPAYFINHHVAHASSCYFRSGFDESAILTHDGFGNGVSYHSGLILYGRGNELFPLSPHHLSIGALYSKVGNSLNLGPVGSAGKLMGLAPYGKPRFFNPDYVGNWYDFTRKYNGSPQQGWLQFCVEMASAMGYDMTALGDRERITEPVNVDIAASTQKLFEECYLHAVYSAHRMLLGSGIRTSRLCLSGGTALNCPSNSKIFREGPFEELFIEPSCGDEGIAIGAALYVYHHLYGNPLTQKEKPYATPYLGHQFEAADIHAALSRHAHQLHFERVADAANSAAHDLQENKVIAWYEGRSESGPRALGHRSIVANPRHADNWKRVNRIKQREWWRPFAPSVLAEHASQWFADLPESSPYMLFTGRVMSDQLPAIKHVDGSARIQTVDASVGEYYRLLQEFNVLSGIPIVLNTSFNGPREPVIETPEQAIAFLLNTELDVLYLQGYRVVRAQAV